MEFYMLYRWDIDHWTQSSVDCETFELPMKIIERDQPYFKRYPYLIVKYVNKPIQDTEDWKRKTVPIFNIEYKLCRVDNGKDLLYEYDKSWEVNYNDFMKWKYRVDGQEFLKCEKMFQQTGLAFSTHT